MNIKDFYIGQEASLSRTFDSESVLQFAQLSGDKNPMHLNESYASKTRFGARIVHGFFVGSLISAVIGNKLPGEGSIYMNQSLAFKRPVFLNDTITAVVCIKDIIEEKSQIILATKCVNQNGKVVIVGEAIMYYPYE